MAEEEFEYYETLGYDSGAPPDPPREAGAGWVLHETLPPAAGRALYVFRWRRACPQTQSGS
jgi:hypothetical protein